VSAPVYYIPKLGRDYKAKDVVSAGLEHILGRPLVPRPAHKGPDGGSGVILGASEHVPANLLGYYPDKQTWHQVPRSEAWMGYLTDDPPTPVDLVRSEGLNGHVVTLGDGNEYLVPVARALVEEDGELRHKVCVPRRTGVDKNGDWTVGEVIDRYAELWAIAEQWWDARIAATYDETKSFAVLDFAGENDAALTALATNYHVGKVEVAHLGLFHGQAVVDILDALIDGPTYLDWIKKKLEAGDPSGGSSTDGG